MNFKTQNAKNIISKDRELSKNAAAQIVNNIDIATFETLCENSEHIFDFIKEKITRTLFEAVDKNNLKNTFAFTKIYDEELSAFIIKSWLKFANEDLSDEICELLENGTKEQKIYALEYFKNINDSIALDLINTCALDEYLSPYAACALSAFGDNTVREKILNNLAYENDEFKKYSDIKFLINYGNKNDISVAINAVNNSPFGANVACDILYKFGAQDFSYNDKLKICDQIINSYPEDIELETIYELNILEFTNLFLQNKDDSYTHRILADLKEILELICSNNIYTYDLSKDCKSEINKINSLLKNFTPDCELITQEIKQENSRALRALETLCRMDCTVYVKEQIIALCSSSDNGAILCQCAKAAKAHGFCNNINQDEILQKISDTNAKALFESYFN